MPVFPVKYAGELPPGQGPTTRADLDVRTGAPELWGQVAQAGLKLTDATMGILDKIQAAEEVVKTSNEQLAMGDAVNIYQTKRQETGDPAERAKLLPKLEADITGLATTRRAKLHATSLIGDLRAGHVAFEINKRAEEAKVGLDIVLQRAVDSNQPELYKKIVSEAVATNQMTRAEGADKLLNAPILFALSNAKRFYEQGDYVSADRLVDLAKKLPGISTKQLEYANNLQEEIKKQAKFNDEQAVSSIMFAARKMGDISNPSDKKAEAERLRNELPKYRLTPEGTRTALSYIDSQEKGQPIPTDWIALSEWKEKHYSLLTDKSPNANYDAAKSALVALAGKISLEDFYQQMEALNKKRSEVVVNALNTAMGLAEANQKVIKGVNDVAVREMMEQRVDWFIEDNKRQPDAGEIHVMIERDVLRDLPTPERPTHAQFYANVSTKIADMTKEPDSIAAAKTLLDSSRPYLSEKDFVRLYWDWSNKVEKLAKIDMFTPAEQKTLGVLATGELTTAVGGHRIKMPANALKALPRFFGHNWKDNPAKAEIIRRAFIEGYPDGEKLINKLLGAPAKTPETPKATTAPVKLPVVRLDDDAAFNALPSGAMFQDETGKKWRKP